MAVSSGDFLDVICLVGANDSSAAGEPEATHPLPRLRGTICRVDIAEISAWRCLLKTWVKAMRRDKEVL
jgi:hypothetical protein